MSLGALFTISGAARGASWGLSSYRGQAGRRRRPRRLQLPERPSAGRRRHWPIGTLREGDWRAARCNPPSSRGKTCPPSGPIPDKQARQPIGSRSALSNVALDQSATEQCCAWAGRLCGEGSGGEEEGNLVMATGLVSVTKFGAAAFAGLRGLGGEGGTPPGRRGATAAAGLLEEAVGICTLAAVKSSYIVYRAPSHRPRGAATLPHCELNPAGCAGALAPLVVFLLGRQATNATETERLSPGYFFPQGAPVRPSLSERGRSAPPRRGAAVWGGGRGELWAG